MSTRELQMIAAVNLLSTECHGAAARAGWWSDLSTGESLIGKRNVPEMLCLIHCEVSEALQGYRKNEKDSHLPNRSALSVELADAIIRIMDLDGALGLDIAGAIVEKMRYNANREDHKRENRLKDGGKKI